MQNTNRPLSPILGCKSVCMNSRDSGRKFQNYENFCYLSLSFLLCTASVLSMFLFVVLSFFLRAGFGLATRPSQHSQLAAPVTHSEPESAEVLLLPRNLHRLPKCYACHQNLILAPTKCGATQSAPQLAPVTQNCVRICASGPALGSKPVPKPLHATFTPTEIWQFFASTL